MKIKQLCSYCDSELEGTIVYVKRIPPKDAVDVEILDRYIEVKCCLCSKVWGIYKGRIVTHKKYIFFGLNRSYALIDNLDSYGGEYEISGSYHGNRFDKGYNAKVADRSSETFEVFIKKCYDQDGF